MGGTLPAGGEKVTIPAGKTMLLDQSASPLGGLYVKGDLVFEDDYHTLTSDWIVVQGQLRVGTEDQPIRTGAKITLSGINPDPNYTSMGARVLGVMGGTLDVHGEDRPGWTRLNATAQKGSGTLTLENASTGWHQGDRVAIASTDYGQLRRPWRLGDGSRRRRGDGEQRVSHDDGLHAQRGLERLCLPARDRARQPHQRNSRRQARE